MSARDDLIPTLLQALRAARDEAYENGLLVEQEAIELIAAHIAGAFDFEWVQLQ